MSQQEFEPRERQSSEEIYQPQYPYTWSDQDQREGMPRDEPPINYGAQMGEPGYQYSVPGVPWWARPQPQPNGTLRLAGIFLFLILLAFIMGALGIAGIVLGSLAHILGIILGAILLLLVFVFLFIIIVLSLVGRALRRAFGPPPR